MITLYCGYHQVWCEGCKQSTLDEGPGNRICIECGEEMKPATKEQLLSEGCEPEDIQEVDENEV